MTRFWGVEESEKKNKPSFFSAFTLAEMMVVMLILSIVLAAMAPVMTTRNKPNNSSPWQYQANNRSNAWFGAGSAQHAMIGQNSYGADDTVAKLLITVGAGDGSTSLLAFKRGNTQLGRLYMNDDGGMMFGSTNNILGTNANAVGRQVSAYGTSSVAFGSVASALGNTSTAVGSNVTAGNTGSIAIGTSTTANADNAIGIGNTSTVSAARSIALGNEAIASAENAVAVGNSAKAQRFDDRHLSSGAIAIGSNANTTEEYSIAIGSNANVKLALDTATEQVTSSGAIAIGRNSVARYLGSIALGDDSIANGYQTKVADIADIPSIAIGSGAKAESTGTIAIGADTTSNVPRSIVIGAGASVGAVGEKEYAGRKVNSASIAIGPNSYAEGKYNQDYDSIIRENSIAIGDKARAVAGGIAIGSIYQSGTISGSNNSLTTTAGNGSVAVGTGTNATGIGAVAVGRQAKASGYHSIAIGQLAEATTLGSVAIGAGAKSTYQNQIVLGTSSDTVYIPGNLVAKGTILLGSQDHNTFIYTNNYDDGNKGYNIMFRADEGTHHERWVSKSDKAGHNYEIGGQTYFLLDSDRRLKYVGKENKSGLDKIRQLKIFNYTYKKDTTKTPHVGVIAQDLQKVFPNAVKKGAEGFLTIRMEDMFYAVINAIKELDAKYQAQEKRINELEKRIEKLEAKAK